MYQCDAPETPVATTATPADIDADTNLWGLTPTERTPDNYNGATVTDGHIGFGALQINGPRVAIRLAQKTTTNTRHQYVWSETFLLH